MSSEEGNPIFNRSCFTKSRSFINGNSHTAEVLSFVRSRLRHTAQTAVHNLDRGELHLRAGQELHRAILGLVSRLDAVDMASECNLTTNRQTTCLIQGHQSIVVGEAVSQRLTIFRTSGQKCDSKEVTRCTVDDLGRGNPAGDSQGVEGGILSLCQTKEATTWLL